MTRAIVIVYTLLFGLTFWFVASFETIAPAYGQGAFDQAQPYDPLAPAAVDPVNGYSGYNRTYSQPQDHRGYLFNEQSEGNPYGRSWQQDSAGNWNGIGALNQGQTCAYDTYGQLICGD